MVSFSKAVHIQVRDVTLTMFGTLLMALPFRSVGKGGRLF